MGREWGAALKPGQGCSLLLAVEKAALVFEGGGPSAPEDRFTCIESLLETNILWPLC